MKVPNKNSGKLSGQSTFSEDEAEPVAGLSKAASSEDSTTLTLNDGTISRQSSHKRKDSKYSKSRSPVMQSLNPTQLQPPASILKAEVLDEAETANGGKNKKVSGKPSFESKRSLQRTPRVDMNDPEQPLLQQKAKNEDVEAAPPSSESPIPPGVVPTGVGRSNSPQVKSGWL